MLPFECLVLNMEPIEREKQNGDQPYSRQRRLPSRQFHRYGDFKIYTHCKQNMFTIAFIGRLLLRGFETFQQNIFFSIFLFD